MSKQQEQPKELKPEELQDVNGGMSDSSNGNLGTNVSNSTAGNGSQMGSPTDGQEWMFGNVFDDAQQQMEEGSGMEGGDR